MSERLGVNIESPFGSKVKIEVVELDFGKIYLVEGKPVLFKINDRILPTLLLKDFYIKAPKVTVDMGAIPYVCNGADIMAPGIVRVEGEFSKGDLVIVIDEKHEKPLALGKSLFDSESIKNKTKGAAIKNFHFVSDIIWKFAKTLAE